MILWTIPIVMVKCFDLRHPWPWPENPHTWRMHGVEAKARRSGHVVQLGSRIRKAGGFP